MSVSRGPAAGSPRGAFSLIELAICTAILGILATAVMPLSEVATRRRAELELRRTLREVRTAIDRYVEDRSRREPARPRPTLYPRDLDELVQARYLRQVPRDPIAGTRQWRLIGTADPPDARDLSVRVTDGSEAAGETSWRTEPAAAIVRGVGHVPPNGALFDLRSTSDRTALDGTAYADW
ncbi:MAG: type II secretion system protein [Candidatus Wallbacteria bacterium]|nr:type II secretion system protein [Candidatus Wallbacteria bacterium]